MSNRRTIALLYGGRSSEHEVSLRSAASVFRHLDRGKFAVVPVAIDKQGRWLAHDAAALERAAGDVLPVDADAVPVVLSPAPARHELVRLDGGAPIAIDVVFPVMHGPLCEDGSIQGLFELAEVPYVGCGVLASSMAMDKEITKRLAQGARIAVVPWKTVRPTDHERGFAEIGAQVARDIGFPCFVKPSNLGSSVGVAKVKRPQDLAGAIDRALAYDRKVLIEKGIDAREIEVAVLESLEAGARPMTSIPGEITPRHEFYSYEAKYLDEDGAALHIPARLSDEQASRARQIAADVFTALECEGLSRVDLFLDRGTGEFYLNEINTLPGFTSISMFPKLWEASGMGYGELLTHLVELAVRRRQDRDKLCRAYTN